MVEDIDIEKLVKSVCSAFDNSLKKSLDIIGDECKNTHSEMGKILEISEKKIDEIKREITNEMSQTRQMIDKRYDYFGALLSYLTAIMTGLFIFNIVQPWDFSQVIKTSATLILTTIITAGVFVIWYKTHKTVTV